MLDFDSIWGYRRLLDTIVPYLPRVVVSKEKPILGEEHSVGKLPCELRGSSEARKVSLGRDRVPNRHLFLPKSSRHMAGSTRIPMKTAIILMTCNFNSKGKA